MIGFAIGDLVYFWLARMAGYLEPFTELPVLSVLVVTVTMTAPMTAWMLYEMPAALSPRCPRRCRSLRLCCWARLARDPPLGSLALLEHGLMIW